MSSLNPKNQQMTPANKHPQIAVCPVTGEPAPTIYTHPQFANRRQREMAKNLLYLQKKGLLDLAAVSRHPGAHISINSERLYDKSIRQQQAGGAAQQIGSYLSARRSMTPVERALMQQQNKATTKASRQKAAHAARLREATKSYVVAMLNAGQPDEVRRPLITTARQRLIGLGVPTRQIARMV